MYRVVIADDEQMIRNGLASLKWADFNMEVIAIARNGVEAEEIIDSTEFELLITDIKMPGMSGLELAKNLAAANPRAKTILLSGYGEFEYARTAISIGVFEYILKPSTPAQILDCARRACEQIEKESIKEEHVAQLRDKIGSYEQLVGSEEVLKEGGNTDIKDILKYIYAHYKDPLTLAALAGEFHFSTVYLSSYIKKYTEHTFLEILTSVRMYHAAKFLKETKLKNAEIGGRIGIPDERYFGQVFKKTYGMTPHEYRKSSIQPNVSLDRILSREELEKVK